MLLSELTGSADIANGAGNVNAKLAGTANIPFSFDAKASFSPESITIGGSGSLENQPIRLVSPAVLAREKDDWVLRQVRVEFAGGTADLSGSGGIGRASCRERVCQYVYISVVGVALKKKRIDNEKKTKIK